MGVKSAVTQTIKGNIVRLKGLIGTVQYLYAVYQTLNLFCAVHHTASLKQLRGEQRSHLQTIIEQKV